MSELPSHAQFLPHCYSEFRLLPEGSTAIDLQLVEVGQLRSTSGQESFAILFRGPLDFVLPQRIYTLDHSSLGRFELFLVPVSRDLQGVYYEAVFSRLVGKN